MRPPDGAVAQRIREVGPAAVCTSLIVACELRYGAEKKQSAMLTERLDRLLAALAVLELPANVDVRYAGIRCALERAGTPIGANDL